VTKRAGSGHGTRAADDKLPQGQKKKKKNKKNKKNKGWEMGNNGEM